MPGWLAKCFLNEQGSLRSGWKVLGFMLLFPAIGVVFTQVAKALHVPRLGMGLGVWINAAVVALASFICVRLEKRPFRDLGFHPGKRWLSEFGAGTLGGILLILVTALAVRGLDGFHWERAVSVGPGSCSPRPGPSSGWRSSRRSCPGASPSSAWWRARAPGWGSWSSPGSSHWATGATRACMAPPGPGPRSTSPWRRCCWGSATCGPGAWRSPSASTWAGTGPRAACWVSASAAPPTSGAWTPVFHGRPEWLTGGTFGLEASLPCTLVCLGVILLLWRWKGVEAAGSSGGASTASAS